MMLPFQLRGMTDRLEEQPPSYLEVQTVTRIAQVVDLIIGCPTSLATEGNYHLKSLVIRFEREQRGEGDRGVKSVSTTVNQRVDGMSANQLATRFRDVCRLNGPVEAAPGGTLCLKRQLL